NYEAFLQYKVDVGGNSITKSNSNSNFPPSDIYGIWFISKNDCPRVTECLICLTQKAKEYEQSKVEENQHSLPFQKQQDILSLLHNAKHKFQDSKPRQEINNSDIATAMPAALLRLFSTQETTIITQSSEDRGEELKKTLGISVKSALSVTELEKQLLQPSVSQEANNDKLLCTMPKNQVLTPLQPITGSTHSNNSQPNPFNNVDTISTGRLMTPAEFQALQTTPSPVPIVLGSNDLLSSHCYQQPQSPSVNQFSKDNLRQLLVDILQNDEDFVTGLHNAYIEKQIHLRRLYS
ncbi:unnamed protein product, partial [Adineta ricciae]